MKQFGQASTASVIKGKEKYFKLLAANNRIALLIPKRALLIVAFLLLGVAAIISASLAIGNFTISLPKVLEVLFSPHTPPGQEVSLEETVIFSLRFPRVLVALLVGMLLSFSGSLLQNTTRNALADPYLVGVSQGASLFVVVAIIGFPQLSSNLRPLFAIVGGFLAGALIMLLSRQKRGSNTIRFILTGIGVAAFISSITSAFLTYGSIYSAMSALTWLAGSLHAVGWSEVLSLALTFIFFLPLLVFLTRPLTVMRMGEEMAISLGVRVKLISFLIISVAIVLAAIPVASVGPLGFVGLIAPHLGRKLVRSGLAMQTLVSGLIGGLLVSLADLLGRAAIPNQQVPAGLITAIIGVPIFILMIVKGQSREI